MTRAITDLRVLIVDDNLDNIEVVEQILEGAGYAQLLSTRDPESVEHLCTAWKPDLILLDLHMPGLTGYQVLAHLRDRISEPNNLPILVVTADGTREARHRALSMGARDFVTKPIDQVELLLRVRNLLQVRQLQCQLQEHNAHLGEACAERTVELEHARLESLVILASIGEYHDDDTSQHTRRVGRSAARIAEKMGVPDAFVAELREAAPLHDIGKIGVPRAILCKPGVLTEDERAVMQRHARIGAEILACASSPVLRLAGEIASGHHERWDGTGYPDGLAGEDIPLAGRITAVADVFDALTHERPYKSAWDPKQAAAEIRAQAGRHFDPAVVKAFLQLDLRELSVSADLPLAGSLA
jgi:putative two-component system response regulator